MRKKPGHDGSCKVTFEVPAAAGTTTAYVCGEFNDWSPIATPLKRGKDGTLSATVTMQSGRGYRFRYLFDDGRWENDWAADSYVSNEFGEEDSVVEV